MNVGAAYKLAVVSENSKRRGDVGCKQTGIVTGCHNTADMMKFVADALMLSLSLWPFWSKLNNYGEILWENFSFHWIKRSAVAHALLYIIDT